MKIKLKYTNTILFHPTFWIVFGLLTLTLGDDAQRLLDVNSNEEPKKVRDDELIVTDSDLEASAGGVVQSSFEEPVPDNAQDSYIPKPDYPFSDILSQNSGISNDVSHSSQDVLVSVGGDTATMELQQRAESSQHNTQAMLPTAANTTQPLVIEQATLPPTEHNHTLNASEADGSLTDTNVQIQVPKIEQPKQNLTEEIPSFSEWTQIQMEETKLREANTTTKNLANIRVRNKNYASPDCGAKIVAANAESVSAHSVLTPSRDEYKLNTCTTPKIWFIVELCEAIQAKKIEMANFELFSSSPKDFTVSVSDRFPTRDWSNIVGQFTAKDERIVQHFDLNPHLFGKYIKVELHTHYGSEHFCPISIFKVFGTTEFEVLEKEDEEPHTNHSDDEDDDDHGVDAMEKGDGAQNLFNSAKDAVISIVKKAAEVLGNNKGNHSNESNEVVEAKPVIYSPLINTCSTPSHLVVCTNCTDLLFGQVYELLSCRSKQIAQLLTLPIIKSTIYNEFALCAHYGFDFRTLMKQTPSNNLKYVKSFFPPRYIAALCNTVAIIENKVVHNISHKLEQYDNVTANAIPENTTTLPTQVNLNASILELESIETRIDSSNSSDVLLVDVIKPTKTQSQDEMIGGGRGGGVDTETSSDYLTATPFLPSEMGTHKSSLVLLEESEVIIPSTPSPTLPASSESLEKIQQQQEQLVVDNLSNSIRIDQNEAGSGSEQTPTDEEAAAIMVPIGDALDLDNIILDLAQQQQQQQQQQQAQTQQPPQIKESVFLRLSNRIKALERNMSLSGQYLEELSRRYKKQVEEMQRLLEKTIVTLNEESQRKDDTNQRLELKLNQLNEMVEELIAERHNGSRHQDYLSPIFFTLVLVTFLVVVKLLRRVKQPAPQPVVKVATNPNELRRKSIDVINHQTPAKKERRPSEEVLKIDSYKHLLIEEVHAEGGQSQQQQIGRINKQKRKKKKNIVRIVCEDQIRQDLALTAVNVVNGHQDIEDIPFVLEECDNNPLQDMPLPKPLLEEPIVDVMQNKIKLPIRKISSPASLKFLNDSKRHIRRGGSPSTGGSQSGGSAASAKIKITQETNNFHKSSTNGHNYSKQENDGQLKKKPTDASSNLDTDLDELPTKATIKKDKGKGTFKKMLRKVF